MAKHKCKIKNCDGTKLGHDLARDFPRETERASEQLRRFSDSEAYAKVEIEYCEEYNSKKQGLCDSALDVHGQCPYASDHGDHFADR